MSPLFFFGLQENILDAYVCYVIVFKFSVLQGPKGSSGKNTKEYSSSGQYLYRNVQFSKASLNGVLFFYESIFEEGGNRSARRKPSKSG